MNEPASKKAKVMPYNNQKVKKEITKTGQTNYDRKINNAEENIIDLTIENNRLDPEDSDSIFNDYNSADKRGKMINNAHDLIIRLTNTQKPEKDNLLYDSGIKEKITTISEKFEDIKKRQENSDPNRKIKIALIGDSGNGKSSIINELIGHDILPTSIGSTAGTTFPIKCEFHEKNTYTLLKVYEQNDSVTEEIQTADDIKSRILDLMKTPNKLIYITVLIPEEIINKELKNVILIDTIGISKDSRIKDYERNLKMKQKEKVDAFFYVRLLAGNGRGSYESSDLVCLEKCDIFNLSKEYSEQNSELKFKILPKAMFLEIFHREEDKALIRNTEKKKELREDFAKKLKDACKIYFDKNLVTPENEADNILTTEENVEQNTELFEFKKPEFDQLFDRIDILSWHSKDDQKFRVLCNILEEIRKFKYDQEVYELYRLFNIVNGNLRYKLLQALKRKNDASVIKHTGSITYQMFIRKQISMNSKSIKNLSEIKHNEFRHNDITNLERMCSIHDHYLNDKRKKGKESKKGNPMFNVIKDTIQSLLDQNNFEEKFIEFYESMMFKFHEYEEVKILDGIENRIEKCRPIGDINNNKDSINLNDCYMDPCLTESPNNLPSCTVINLLDEHMKNGDHKKVLELIRSKKLVHENVKKEKIKCSLGKFKYDDSTNKAPTNIVTSISDASIIEAEINENIRVDLKNLNFKKFLLKKFDVLNLKIDEFTRADELDNNRENALHPIFIWMKSFDYANVENLIKKLAVNLKTPEHFLIFLMCKKSEEDNLNEYIKSKSIESNTRNSIIKILMKAEDSLFNNFMVKQVIFKIAKEFSEKINKFYWLSDEVDGFTDYENRKENSTTGCEFIRSLVFMDKVLKYHLSPNVNNNTDDWDNIHGILFTEVFKLKGEITKEKYTEYTTKLSKINAIIHKKNIDIENYNILKKLYTELSYFKRPDDDNNKQKLINFFDNNDLNFLGTVRLNKYDQDTPICYLKKKTHNISIPKSDDVVLYNLDAFKNIYPVQTIENYKNPKTKSKGAILPLDNEFSWSIVNGRTNVTIKIFNYTAVKVKKENLSDQSDNSDQIISYYKCHSDNCDSCPYAIEPLNDSLIPIGKKIDCNSSGVVYLIQCDKCKGVYIGETERSIKTRIREHILSINNFNPQNANKNTTVSTHFSKEGHSRDNFNFFILKSDLADTRCRKNSETDNIKKFSDLGFKILNKQNS